MATSVLCACSNGRKAAALFTAAAVLLPLPASCLACSAGPTDCRRCASAHEPTTATASSSCCRRHAASEQTAAIERPRDLLEQQSSPFCCCEQQSERPLPAAPLRAPTNELDAGLPTASLSLANTAEVEPAAAPLGPADLFPPVPHRILHCSWQI